jgi:malate dehydrogenase (oxaloacetate-decarboxylating)
MHELTSEQQVNRAYRQFKECSTDLAKNSFCESMRKQNEILYFKMIQTHLKEMFSIVSVASIGNHVFVADSRFTLQRRERQ